METIAPGDIITVLQPDNPWIVTILVTADLGLVTLPIDGFVVQAPMNSILAETALQVHLPFLIVTTKNACKFTIEWDDSTVENAVRRCYVIPVNDRIAAVTPDNIRISVRSILPGKICLRVFLHGLRILCSFVA